MATRKTPKNGKPLSELTSAELLKLAAERLAEEDGKKETAPKPKAPKASDVPLAQRRKADESKIPAVWRKVEHTCPNCGFVGKVSPYFGIKTVRGVVRSQSWCVHCRSTTNYYLRERKNRTKNYDPDQA